MSWSAETKQIILGAVDEFTPWLVLKPGETINIQVVRTDATPVNDWGIQIQATTEPTRTITDAIIEMAVDQRFPATTLFPSVIVLADFYAVRTRVFNAAVVPTDVVDADVFTRVNNVSF